MSELYYQKENFNGTYDFRSRLHNGYVIESHIHEYSELLYCKKGICEIAVNGKTIHLRDNEFVFIPPNYIHRYNGVNVEVICAVFSNDFIPLFFKKAKGRGLAVKKLKAEELSGIFLKLPELNKNNDILITAYLNLICNKVMEGSAFEKVSGADGILFQKVISYIADNFAENISLKQIAQKFGYNEKYLSSALHSLTGIHFSEFIAMYRVEYAKELLSGDGELSITRISEKCGFAAINTFNRQFKKITGIVPTQYRRIYSITKNRML